MLRETDVIISVWNVFLNYPFYGMFNIVFVIVTRFEHRTELKHFYFILAHETSSYNAITCIYCIIVFMTLQLLIARQTSDSHRTICNCCCSRNWIKEILINHVNYSLALGEKHTLGVFENRVLRRLFRPKSDEVTGEWRKLHKEELQDLYSSPSIIRIIKARRMR
jgi:hypothetical protein